MTEQRIIDELKERRNAVNETLEALRPFSTTQRLADAIQYVLFPGGKRLRSILTLAAGEAFGERSESLLKIASAVELLHIASLVFDDLPAMDGTAYRHDKPALHAKYTPDLAVLCGHSLVSLAFHLATQTSLDDKCIRRIVAELSFCIGPVGMAAGQARDLCGQSALDACDACHIAESKTAPLFGAAAYCGALAGGASQQQAQLLRAYGVHLGTAYQIADDIRDYPCEDSPDRSTNVVAAVGPEEARSLLGRHIELAGQSLDGTPRKALLIDFAGFMKEFVHV